MLWCVPPNSESSTWSAGDVRFVVRVHRQVASVKHVWDEVALLEDLPQMVLSASRRDSQTTELFARDFVGIL